MFCGGHGVFSDTYSRSDGEEIQVWWAATTRYSEIFWQAYQKVSIQVTVLIDC